MSRITLAPIFALLLASLPTPLQASADTLQGRVVGVTDGDTITLLDAFRTQHKIRLAGIDAPVPPWDFRKMKREGGV